MISNENYDYIDLDARLIEKGRSSKVDILQYPFIIKVCVLLIV